MAKISKDVAGALFPTPVVLVTTIDTDGKPNIVTLAWAGVLCSNPFLISIAIRPSRYSHALLEKTPELTINLPTEEILGATDYCGTVSGRDVDKFTACGLTPVQADEIGAPLIKECPINLECRVTDKLALGTHDVFVSRVVKAHFDDGLVDGAGKIDFGRIKAFAYLDKDYRVLAEKIGSYGFTAKK